MNNDISDKHIQERHNAYSDTLYLLHPSSHGPDVERSSFTASQNKPVAELDDHGAASWSNAIGSGGIIRLQPNIRKGMSGRKKTGRIVIFD